MTDTPENLYVYAVMRREDRPDLDLAAVSAPGEQPIAIDCGALQAIASPIAVDEVLSTRRNMTTHAKALERMMAAGPVLPMRFGLITRSEELIRETVSAAEETLTAKLDDIDGCVEMGVRIHWNREIAMREIVAERPALAETYRKLFARSEAETRFDRVELGRRVEAAMSIKRKEEADAYLAQLQKAARETVVQEPDDEMMVLKTDHLIDAAREPDLAALVEDIEAKAPERVLIKYVGPAPAYNFVQIHLDWAEPDRLALAG